MSILMPFTTQQYKRIKSQVVFFLLKAFATNADGLVRVPMASGAAGSAINPGVVVARLGYVFTLNTHSQHTHTHTLILKTNKYMTSMRVPLPLGSYARTHST